MRIIFATSNHSTASRSMRLIAPLLRLARKEAFSYQPSAIREGSFQLSAISFQEKKLSVMGHNCSGLASLSFTAFSTLDCRLWALDCLFSHHSLPITHYSCQLARSFHLATIATKDKKGQKLRPATLQQRRIGKSYFVKHTRRIGSDSVARRHNTC